VFSKRVVSSFPWSIISPLDAAMRGAAGAPTKRASARRTPSTNAVVWTRTPQRPDRGGGHRSRDDKLARRSARHFPVFTVRQLVRRKSALLIAPMGRKPIRRAYNHAVQSEANNGSSRKRGDRRSKSKEIVKNCTTQDQNRRHLRVLFFEKMQRSRIAGSLPGILAGAVRLCAGRPGVSGALGYQPAGRANTAPFLRLLNSN
jgi:hypothetical protein